MNTITVFALVVLAVTSVLSADDFYDSKFDNFDVESVLSNERLLNSYVNCLLDKGGCTPEGKHLKRLLPDALETSCAKCRPVQSKRIKTVVKFVMKNHPDKWEMLVQHFDKEGKHRASFQEFLNKED